MANNNKNEIKIRKGKKTKSISPSVDKWVIVAGLALFVIIGAAAVSPILASIISGQSQGDVRIDIKNKNNKSFEVNECDSCERLVIRDKDGRVVFEESLESNTENKLREYLINKGKEGDKPNSILKLASNGTINNRLVDISFDISNSVLFRDSESLRSNARIKYSDVVFQKFRDYVTGNNTIRAGDTVQVRFYGPEFRQNPCNNKLVINYTETEWDADITYSQRNNQILIEIGDKLPPKFESSESGLVTNDPQQLYSTMYDFYAKGISDSNPGCHHGTYLIPHLIKVGDDVINKTYSTRDFILVTDGEFYLRDDEVTDGAEAYIYPKDYTHIIKYLQKRSPKEFIVNGSTLCQTHDDRFIIVGMEYDNNLSYRNSVQQFYRELLDPCQVVFENY